MGNAFDQRRYLTNFDSARTGHVLTDVLVIGGGVAGARAAIEAARHTDNVILMCKRTVEDSVTRHAQGGIAGVMTDADSVESHAEDTFRVGCGLGRREIIDRVVRDGPARIAEMVDWGMRLDRSADGYALGREGGHSASRILHFEGDATGRELSRALTAKLRTLTAIRVFESCFLIDLLTVEGRCVGAVSYHPKYGHQLVWSKQTILATGGCGRLFRETTNPDIATGDGYAAAWRAGARLADMEMMQFHPTTLYVAGASRALISEAVRGEGAYLVDRHGERFMPSYHADAELAPRDVVSRAIVNRIRETRSNCVYLDVRHIGGERFAARFPRITRLCRDFQIDPARDLIPVRPAAHYMIGGVVTDGDARTNVPDLLACGEAACTGLHGANRLASNSLLEGLVFGAIAGATAGASLSSGPNARGRVSSVIPASQRTELDLPDILNSLRSLLWRNAGIERHAAHLSEAREIIDFWGQYVLDKTFDDVLGWESQNMLTVARLLVIAAAQRSHSLGVHYRSDELNASTVVSDTTDPHHWVNERDESGPVLRPMDRDWHSIVEETRNHILPKK
ncbi:MAG: L-aspartate oxidase [Phycisphaerales bacterium]|nr:L-aspartate oxidase [Phycisphaerales bacterium]